MNDLKGPGGELRMTISITRKATGKTETVELVGKTTPEQHQQIVENFNVSDTQHGVEGRGD
jgi:hypothetical protein